MEPSEANKEQEQNKTANVWRGTPRVWERCMFCEVNKKCAAAGVVRGSKACADARYALMKR
jgi:hypothetical protein